MTRPGGGACTQAARRACENLMTSRGVTERVSAHLFGGGLRGSGEPFAVVVHEGDEREFARLCDVELAIDIAIGQKTDGSASFACFNRSFERI